MDAYREKIEDLTRRINELAQQQTSISRQLIQLVNELELLKQQVTTSQPVSEEPIKVPEKVIEFQKPIEAPVHQKVLTPVQKKQPVKTATAATSNTLEEFVGKNLASKIGILVTIIGVFIGSKYAIDHDLVSPAVRIIAGYACGGVLVALALRLKKKYEAYSAVLMGGGIAVLYFITFIAYSFYNLLPQIPAFGLMLLFTVGTVYAALLYNMVIIAHLGLVGAYAIPFLLSNNSGRVEILFSYMAIINAGILVLSFRKYWKSLFYVAFGVTWLIYSGWLLAEYNEPDHFNLAILFLCVFFVLFYATFLAYKLVKKEQYGFSDVTILLSNAFIFYGWGYFLMNSNERTENYLGIFTVVNAGIHLAISEIIRNLKLADKTLYFFVLGLVIVFLTIAIPVQLDGNWVTLLWTAEAVMVFIIGRTRGSAAYEKIGTALVVLSFISLWQDWFSHFQFIEPYPDFPRPFFSITFATGLLVCAAQGIIIYVNRNKKYTSAVPNGNFYRACYDYVVPILFFISSYFVFLWEIMAYFAEVLEGRQQLGRPAAEIETFRSVVVYLYSMIYLTVFTLINRVRIRNTALQGASLIATLFMALIFLMMLRLLNICSINYHHYGGRELYFGILNFFIRYIVAFVMALLLYLGYLNMREAVKDNLLHNGWSITIHVVTLGFISAEYLNWTTVTGADNQYKLGLSIVWGLYALFMIVIGIWKKKKHLRLSAIILFSIILVKLFLYDLAEAGTITKTISFISLGVILLLVSYLYNRYKDVLFGEKPTSP